MVYIILSLIGLGNAALTASLNRKVNRLQTEVWCLEISERCNERRISRLQRRVNWELRNWRLSQPKKTFHKDDFIKEFEKDVEITQPLLTELLRKHFH